MKSKYNEEINTNLVETRIGILTKEFLKKNVCLKLPCLIQSHMWMLST